MRAFGSRKLRFALTLLVSLTFISANAAHGRSGTIAIRAGDANTRHDLYVVNPDTGDVTRLTNDDISDQHIAGSRRRDVVAFTHWGDERGIYVINTDGTGLTNLTPDDKFALAPAWSPDGRKIAYITFVRGDGSPDIAVMDADGAHKTILTEHNLLPAIRDALVWTPDGKEIWYQAEPDSALRWKTYALNIRTGRTRFVMQDPGSSLRISPDRKHLAFYSKNCYCAAISNALGGGIRPIGPVGKSFLVSWSPDSKELVYAETLSWGKGADLTDLVVFTILAGSRRRVVRLPMNVTGLDWFEGASLAGEPVNYLSTSWGELKRSVEAE